MQVRSGAGGQVKDRPSDIIVARFDHYTTREGDPNIHSHCVVMNVAGATRKSSRYNTRHLTIETAEVYRWQKIIGAAYRAAMAEQLGRQGFTFRAAGRRQWEVEGIPETMIESFSKRSHQIEAKVGRGASGAQKEIAALQTRSAKDLVPSGEELEARWKTQFIQHGIDPWQAALERSTEPVAERNRSVAPEKATDLDRPEVPGTTPVAIAASQLFRNESVVGRPGLLGAALVEAGLNGVGIQPVYDELARLGPVEVHGFPDGC